MPICEQKKIPVFIVKVGQKVEWKDKQHPLRKDKFYRLKSIPTMILVNENQ